LRRLYFQRITSLVQNFSVRIILPQE
jgi:hypothetical protein